MARAASVTLALCLGVAPAAAGCAHGGSAPTAPPAGRLELTLSGPAELVLPGVVPTPRTEVRIAFSPDGARALWGVIGWEGGPGGWEILESIRDAAGWGPPHVVPFAGPANEFDPSFAPDGSGVYFFSNRPGGQGGDDLWYAPLDAAARRWGAAANLGPGVNTAGDEWAPCVSPDGTALLFASDGRGGGGRHDLFLARRGPDGAWGDAVTLAGVNGAAEDFDAAWLGGGEALVYASGDLDGAVALHWASREGAGWVARGRLGPEVNGEGADPFVIGPSACPAEGAPPRSGGDGWLCFSAKRAGGAGRLDVWRVRYRLGGAGGR